MSAVPQLRFPEFDGEWVRCNVGDFCSFSKGKGIAKSDIAEDGALPCIRYGELYTHYGVKIDEVASRTNIPAEALVLSEGGEVIIPASGETPEDISTAAVVMDCGVALGGDLNILRTKSDGYFIASYISGKARLRLASMAQGNSVVHLYGAQIASLEMCLPPLPEQQKVASFLSSVDKKIDLLRQKKDALETYKTGLMQKIFSQEIRFKQDDGSYFPDWEEVVLGDVADVYQPKTISQQSLDEDAAYLVYGANGIIGRFYEFNHEKEQIAITCRGSTCGFVNLTQPYSWITGNAMVVNVDSNKNVVKRFLYYLLKSTDWSYQISGSGQPQITGSIKKHKMLLPLLVEQEKIAQLLETCDTKIQNTSSQIEQMETFKKGLLQQMFV